MVQSHVAQVTLDANGIGNTYEDVNAVFAPGHNIIEVPDCAHSSFGRHIDEVFDKKLNTYVFRFLAHKTTDNDRCKKFDRQRTEIKTYSKSPENTKGAKGETVEYKWKFKLPNNFKVSKKFTHLHQIKSVGSEYSRPIISLTARKGTPDRLELRYAPTYKQSTIHEAELDLFRGRWVEVTEIIHYANNGSYSIEIKSVSNGSKLFSYSNDNIDMWQDGSSFSRPKWGIYRSLKHKEDLQDEAVFFNNFSIEEIKMLSATELEIKADASVLNSKQPNGTISFKKLSAKDYDEIKLFNKLGEEVSINKKLKKYKLDISSLNSGLHYLVFLKSKRIKKVLKLIVK